MDNLIKEIVKDFKKQWDKDNHEVTIVAKVNKKGDMEALGVSGAQSCILSILCLIFEETSKQSEFSAKELAKICYKTLELCEGSDD